MDPVLYRTALIDTKSGSMSREWIRYFNQLGAGGDTSMFFKQPNYIKFNNTAADPNDGKIGNSLFAPGLNLVGINNDGTARKIQIWGGVTQNENWLGNTWAGKNTFSDPANIVFGPNFSNYTPRILGGAGSLITYNVSIKEARYIRIGPVVHFTLTIWFGIAGTGNTLTIDLPVPAVVTPPFGVNLVSGGLYLPTIGVNEVAFAYIGSGSPGVVNVLRHGSLNYPVSDGTQIFVSGTYPVA